MKEILEFISQNIGWLASICSACLSLLGAIIVFICRIAKSKKAERVANTALAIIRYAQEGVELAEQFSHFSGAEKKAYATTKIKEWCISNGVEYSDEAISEAIEKVIELSKNVNAKNSKNIASL